jgi:hypothetical protein
MMGAPSSSSSPLDFEHPLPVVRAPSPRQQHVVASNASKPVFTQDGVSIDLERKPSTKSYSHNRQTSIVHGYQHSRNASFVTSPNLNPLSPQMINAAGAVGMAAPDADRESFIDLGDFTPIVPPLPTTNGSVSSFATLVPSNTASISTLQTLTSNHRPSVERSASRGQNGGTITRKRLGAASLERTRSTKSGRDRSHSHSKHHHLSEVPKSVGEYAVRIILDEVSQTRRPITCTVRYSLLHEISFSN